MKLILTEEQLNLLLQTEGVARLLQESLGDSKNLENLKGIIRKLLATGVALTTIVAALTKQNLPQSEIDMLVKAAQGEAELKKTPLNHKYLDHHYNEYTYPIQDHRTKDLIRSLKMKLQNRGFYFTGRFADWEYYNMDIAMGASMDICKIID
jgi:hypothetical protein